MRPNGSILEFIFSSCMALCPAPEKKEFHSSVCCMDYDIWEQVVSCDHPCLLPKKIFSISKVPGPVLGSTLKLQHSVYPQCHEFEGCVLVGKPEFCSGWATAASGVSAWLKFFPACFPWKNCAWHCVAKSAGLDSDLHQQFRVCLLLLSSSSES